MIPPELFKLLPEGASVVAVLISIFAFLIHIKGERKACRDELASSQKVFSSTLAGIREDNQKEMDRAIQSHETTNRILAAANRRMNEDLCERVDKLTDGTIELQKQGGRIQEFLGLLIQQRLSPDVEEEDEGDDDE